MKFIELIKSALSSIWSRKARSFLTSLGVIIGVFAVCALLSVGQGSINAMKSEISDLNGDVIEVTMFDQTKQVTLDEMDEMKQNENIDEICPVGKTTTTIDNLGSEYNINAVATNSAYKSVKGLKILNGRFISELDEQEKNKSVVLGLTICLKLFGNTDVIGENVFLGNTEFTVVGILNEAKQFYAGNPNEEIYVTVDAGKQYLKIKNVESMIVMPAAEKNKQAVEYLNKYLKEKFGTMDSFYIMSNEQIQEFMKSTNKIMMSLLGGIGGISLLVSGIGIMNIMLVSVRERTKEIGIRKAIGAKRKDILIQFLVEAMALSLVGGLLGIGLARLVVPIIGMAMNTSMSLSAGVVLLSVTFSLAVGIAFGIYPAIRASKLRPVEALHYQ